MAARAASKSAASARLNRDEPNFVSGLTGLFVGEDWPARSLAGRKYMIVGSANQPDRSIGALYDSLPDLEVGELSFDCFCELMTPAFVRPGLWHEPVAPNFLVTLRLVQPEECMRLIAAVKVALEEVAPHTNLRATAYDIDELCIV